MKESRKAIGALTAARGVAAWWVVAYHFKELIWINQENIFYEISSRGYLAVDLFFVMSGFIIQYNYGYSPYALSLSSVRSFFVARFARVYPLHFFMNFLFLLNPLAISCYSSSAFIGERYDSWAFIQSFFLVQAWGFGNAFTWNVPSWSISVEFATYLVVPILSWVVLRSLHSFYSVFLWLAGSLMLLGVVFSANELHSLGEGINKCGIPRCIFSFAAGMAVQRIYIKILSSGEEKGISRISLLGALFVLFIGHATDVDNYWFVPLFFCFVILYLSLSKDFFIYFFENRFFIFLGKLSYATYMCHFFVKDWVKFFDLDRYVQYNYGLLLCYMFILLFSFVLFKYIETPSRECVKKYFS
jgi:peptidoglycan/LPS O-acetylase OafA/YrhL